MKKIPTAANAKNVAENYKIIAFSCMLGVLTTAAVLFLSAFVISSVDFPQSGIAPLAIGASVAGCFAAGFICGKVVKGGGLLYGLLCGSVIFLLGLLCELSFMGGEMGILSLYKLVVAVTSAMIGGVLGVNTRRKAR